MLKALVDGRATASRLLADRGLHYGDGLFETLAVVDSVPLLWQRHMARLGKGSQRLRMPEPDPTILEAEAQHLCQGVRRGVLKILYTRGAAGRGYRPAGGSATRILLLYPPGREPAVDRERGLSVRVCSTVLGYQPALAGLKHLNRLEQVLARAEWDDPRIAEGLMLDTEGHVIEATQSNVFSVRGGRLFTPDLSRCGIAGVMRGYLLDNARALGIPTEVGYLSLDELWSADEVFLCNSLGGVMPVGEVGETTYPIGDLTRRLAACVAAVALL